MHQPLSGIHRNRRRNRLSSGVLGWICKLPQLLIGFDIGLWLSRVESRSLRKTISTMRRGLARHIGPLTWPMAHFVGQRKRDGFGGTTGLRA